MIGDEVEVSVLAVSRDKIRLGITAPREIPVFRKEVYLVDPGGAGGRGRRSARTSQNGGSSERVEDALDELSKD